MNDVEKMSYALGMNVAGNITELPVELDFKQVLAAISDVSSGKKPALELEEYHKYMQSFQQKVQEAARTAAANEVCGFVGSVSGCVVGAAGCKSHRNLGYGNDYRSACGGNRLSHYGINVDDVLYVAKRGVNDLLEFSFVHYVFPLNYFVFN